MPSKKNHREHGERAAVREYRQVCRDQDRKPNRVSEAVVKMLGSYCATLPDRMEPPTHGGHRKEWHGTERYYELWDKRERARKSGRSMRAAMITAEMSHLELDGQTPASLPITRKKNRRLWEFG